MKRTLWTLIAIYWVILILYHIFRLMGLHFYENLALGLLLVVAIIILIYLRKFTKLI